jgi:outer membrane receptor for ferrienterochelin and colicins
MRRCLCLHKQRSLWVVALLTLPLLVYSPTSIYAQSTVKGTVYEAAKTPLVGANVYWLGTQQGTVTNVEGKFEIKTNKNSKKLIISFVGFKNDTIDITTNLAGLQDLQGFSGLEIVLKSNTELDAVEVIGERKASYTDYIETKAVKVMTEKELFKAACCNLSESFETNPSVDVNFADAVSGTKQIEMLGLAGTYTQITTEVMPSVRGLGSYFGLSYIPGTWINSIQVAKGVGSVVNGYESIAGQINVELKKPEFDEKLQERLFFNTYIDGGGRMEANLNLAKTFNKKWGTALLLHGSARPFRSDMNMDHFLDFPLTQQFNIINRWAYRNAKTGIEAQFGVKYVTDSKLGGEFDFKLRGQTFRTQPVDHAVHTPMEHAGMPQDTVQRTPIWGLEINTQRTEGWGKIGWVNKKKPYQSIGLQLSATDYRQNAYFGLTTYRGNQQTGYANLIYQTVINNTNHIVKMGTSLLYDKYDERFNAVQFARKEVVAGTFFEYTYTHSEKFNMVAGLRADYHNLFGLFVTPRLHARYAPTETTVFRFAVGRGQRTANIFAENMAIFASSRTMRIQTDNINSKAYGLNPEVAWNYGINFTQDFTFKEKEGNLNIDFYRTNFENQIVVDLDRTAREINFYNLEGKSYSNSLQVELNYELAKHFDVRLAYRWYDVKTTYSGQLLQRPLVSQNRAFVNLAYMTRSKWTFDYTVQWWGRKRLPNTTANPEQFRLDEFSPSFFLMNAQVTKSFSWAANRKKFDAYLGLENILNFRQEMPIIGHSDPFGRYFDSSIVWGPIFGRMVYAGLRFRVK